MSQEALQLLSVKCVTLVKPRRGNGRGREAENQHLLGAYYVAGKVPGTYTHCVCKPHNYPGSLVF